MPQPAEVTAKASVFKGQLEDGSGGNQVYVSPNHRLSARMGSSPRSGSVNINYAVVIDPKTKQQTVYEREYNLLGQPQPLDPKKAIATRGPDGTFTPTKYATDNVDPRIVKKLTNDETTQATLANVSDYTAKSSLKQVSADGKPPSATEVAEVLDLPVEDSGPELPDNTGGNDEEAAGDGSLNGTTITSSAGQDTVNLGADGKNDLKYPIDASGNESDYVKFTAMKYEATKLNTSGGFGTTYQQGTSVGQSVQLPIQGGIQDSNAVGWNEDNLSALQAAGADIATETISGGIGSGIASILGQIKNLQDNNAEVKSAIVNAIAGQAVGSNIIARTERSIFNPNTELLFQGPQLRAFSFNFKLTPRSQAEANEVKSIIKFFKFHMAPKTTDANIFLKAPNIFKIQYFHRGTEHSGINLIKDCALQSCAVDYTPDGTYMAYDDGAMISYDLNLQFMELVPIYAKDYSESDHSIGY